MKAFRDSEQCWGCSLPCPAMARSPAGNCFSPQELCPRVFLLVGKRPDSSHCGRTWNRRCEACGCLASLLGMRNPLGAGTPLALTSLPSSPMWTKHPGKPEKAPWWLVPESFPDPNSTYRRASFQSSARSHGDGGKGGKDESAGAREQSHRSATPLRSRSLAPYALLR